MNVRTHAADALIMGMVLVGCTATRTVTRATREWPYLGTGQVTTQTSDNVTIAVASVVPRPDGPDGLLHIAQRVTGQGLLGREPTTTTQQVVSPVTWPIVALMVQNRTDHVISFERAVVALVNGRGDSYTPSPIEGGTTFAGGTDPPEVYAAAQAAQERSTQLAAVRKAYPNWIGTGPFAPILPEGAYRALVAFDVPEDVRRDRTLTWRLKVYDFVVTTDSAGNPSKRTKFEFDLTPAAITVPTEDVHCEPAAINFDSASNCP